MDKAGKEVMRVRKREEAEVGPAVAGWGLSPNGVAGGFGVPSSYRLLPFRVSSREWPCGGATRLCAVRAPGEPSLDAGHKGAKRSLENRGQGVSHNGERRVSCWGREGGGVRAISTQARTSQIWEKVGWPGGGGGRGGGATVPSSTSAMDGGAGVSAVKHARKRENWSLVRERMDGAPWVRETRLRRYMQ